MLEELLDVETQSYYLGLKLKLPLPVVKSIHSSCSNPKDCLLQVIISFIEQVENPTWRVIVDALRSRAVNLPHLAKKVEAAHCPDSTLAWNVVSEITPTGNN